MENKDPKYNTTLYNHININKNGLPLISNADYQFLHLQVTNGNKTALNEALKKYTIEPKQLKMLTDILEKRVL